MNVYVTFKNLGHETATGVHASLTSAEPVPDDDIIIETGDVTLGSIAPGETATNILPLKFKVNENLDENRYYKLGITVYDDADYQCPKDFDVALVMEAEQ